MWKTTWRHNVENMRQKDIITINVPLFKKLRDIIFFLRDNNLHVSQVWLQQWKVYSHPPSSICPFPISPSLIPPSPNPPSLLLVSLMTKTKRMIVWPFVSLISKERDKKYRGFHFLYRCGNFTMYFLSRCYAVRERNTGQCEKRPDGIT